MDTASFQFVLFGLGVAALANFAKIQVRRSAVLLASSIVFLILIAPNVIGFLPFAAFVLLGYVGLVLHERGWSTSRATSIVVIVFVYAWLKKYTFLPNIIFLQFPYFTLGLSYIFFRILHLLIEASDRDKNRHIEFGAYLLYTLNFTTLVSGPIQRYDDFCRDQDRSNSLPLGPGVVGLQLERILRGFFKVNVMAMLLNVVQFDAIAQMSLAVPLSYKVFAAAQLAVVYPLFLYSNFSGYIDIVIALARLMRIRLPENFDRPFFASSFLDFWNRWHITLSTWLKTYVYNPLLVALMRRISIPTLQPLLGVLSFFVTFFLVGIWHGRTSEFAFFGVLQGGGVAINKLWQLGLVRLLGRKRYSAICKNAVYIAFGRGLTFAWFAFTLFWFWASWQQIANFVAAIGPARWLVLWISVWLSSTAVLAFWEWLRTLLLTITTSRGPVLLGRYARVVYATGFGLGALIFTALLNQPAPAIIYKAF